ncbi:hypothetical protein ON010_g10602 [Phytophthora cinnamomi]|nr:hypothetical protein ON010_g10602 [Phytophthora cinnamomi]
MKAQIVIAALATLLSLVHGVDLQCAGGTTNFNESIGSGVGYESSGFLTADFTQKSCARVGGWIIPDRKGNDKCCRLPDSRNNDFVNACNQQKAGNDSKRGKLWGVDVFPSRSG